MRLVAVGLSGSSNLNQMASFALLSSDVTGTDDVKLPQIPDPREPVVTQPEPEKGWFSKLIDSIFGSSCTGGR